MAEHLPHPLLTARYGREQEPSGIAMTPAVETMVRHQSVRHFTEEPLPEGALNTMVAAAQSASTSSNLHQWSVITVSDPERKRELQRLARSETLGREPAFVSSAPTILLWVADQSRNRALVEASGEDTSIFETLDMFLAASLDAALAAQNAAVAAESLGLGIVYLGAMRNHARELAEFLDLPPYAYVVFGMAVGYPDTASLGVQRPRPAQEVVVHEEKYQVQDTESWLPAYESVFSEFRHSNGMSDKTWADTVAGATGLGYMDGRDKLRGTLDERGFGFH